MLKWRPPATALVTAERVQGLEVTVTTHARTPFHPPRFNSSRIEAY